MSRIDLDFSDVDPMKVELLPAGFEDLQRRANAGVRSTGLGGYGFPMGSPVVWFVVCGDEGHMDEAVHLAVCADEATARGITERIARGFVDAGVARIRRPN